MPVIPGTAAPFPTANEVLNRARAITNDAARSLAGNLLSNSQPYTFEDANRAYEDLQYELANHGYEDMIFDTVINALPACDASVVTDPAIQLYISYSGFFDGVNILGTPVLPNDMMIPLRLWERQSGTLQNFYQVSPVNDGLPSIGRNGSLRYWDWINNTIYLVGATQVQDVRLRYVRRLQALVDGDSLVQIPDSKDAMANLIAYTFAKSRGSQLADSFKADAMEDITRMCTRTSRKKQRGSHRRIGYGQRQSSGFGYY